MSLSRTFNAKVMFQMHSNPPILGLYSEELGWNQVALRDLKLSESEINALADAAEVSGTYTPLKKARTIYAPGKTLRDPWAPQNVTWKVTSIAPKK